MSIVLNHFQSVLPTLADGDNWESLCDANGRSLTSTIVTNTPSVVISGTPNVNVVNTLTVNVNEVTWSMSVQNGVVAGVVKASPGFLGSLVGSSTDGGVRYCQLFNKTTNPVNGDIPFFVARMLANSPFYLDGLSAFGRFGISLSTGISYGISTTVGTYTASGNPGNFFVQVMYR